MPLFFFFLYHCPQLHSISCSLAFSLFDFTPFSTFCISRPFSLPVFSVSFFFFFIIIISRSKDTRKEVKVKSSLPA